MAAEALSAIRQLPPAHLAVGSLDLLTHEIPQKPELDVSAHLMPGVRLRHYKGGLNRVEGACLIEDTRETGILYQPEQGNATHLLAWSPAPFLAHSRAKMQKGAFFEHVSGANGADDATGRFGGAKALRTPPFTVIRTYVA
jgi:hypothetical protein